MARILSKELISQNYDIRQIIEAIEESYKLLDKKKITVPDRCFESTTDDGDYMYGAATNLVNETFIVLGSPYMPWRAEEGEPIVEAGYLYISFRTGEILAVINGVDLVNYRTGAKSAVAAKYLARKTSSVLGLIGLGAQARTQAEALSAVFKFDQILGYSPNSSRRKDTLSYVKEKTGLQIELVSRSEVISQSDILITATHSSKPLATQDELKPGQLIISLAHSEEVSKDIVSQNKSYVDYLDTAQKETGPVKIAVEAGTYNYKDLAGDLGQLLSHKIKGREDEDEIIYFQSLGVMNENLATIEYLYETLQEKAPEITL